MPQCTMVFLTGLSGAGKSTIAQELQKELNSSEVIDGDALRKSYQDDLPPGLPGLEENIRRLIDRAVSLLESRRYIISSFVSPDATLRGRVKVEMEAKGIRFVEVYIKASIHACESRDVKGLYARYREGGDIKLAGLTEEYQEPKEPALTCDTERFSIQENVQ